MIRARLAGGESVQDVLRSLGSPMEVAATERERVRASTAAALEREIVIMPSTPGPTPPEVAAVVVLVVAGVIGPFAWPVAVVLWAGGLWTSLTQGRWTPGEWMGLAVLSPAWGVTIDVWASDAAPVGFVAGVVLMLVLWSAWLVRSPSGRPLRS